MKGIGVRRSSSSVDFHWLQEGLKQPLLFFISCSPFLQLLRRVKLLPARPGSAARTGHWVWEHGGRQELLWSPMAMGRGAEVHSVIADCCQYFHLGWR